MEEVKFEKIRKLSDRLNSIRMQCQELNQEQSDLSSELRSAMNGESDFLLGKYVVIECEDREEYVYVTSVEPSINLDGVIEVAGPMFRIYKKYMAPNFVETRHTPNSHTVSIWLNNPNSFRFIDKDEFLDAFKVFKIRLTGQMIEGLELEPIGTKQVGNIKYYYYGEEYDKRTSPFD